MDNEREPEISEETLRLVRELGERLEEDAEEQGLRPRMSMRTMSDAVYVGSDRLGSEVEGLRRELDVIDRQMKDLIGRREMLQSELRRLQRDPEASRYRSFMGRLTGLGGRRLPDYLRQAERDIEMGGGGGYWLHGEDARERARAVDALALRLAAGGKLSWVTAVVNLSVGASRRQARVTNELELAVRRVWDAWEDPSSGGPNPSLLAAAALRSAASGGRAGVAIILGEFPARKKKAAGFLDWLTSGMAMGSIPMLLFVSTESPPTAAHGRGFQAVPCETAAARLGRHVAELRLRRGWNRAELAKRVDMPQSMIREIEAGLRESWDDRVLLRVAGALGVTLDELESDPNRR